MYVEDIELCWRLERAGWSSLLHQDAVVVHHGNAAGAQRWGEGAGLELRSLPNVYEWLWSERSPRQGRATALTNALGVGTKRRLLQLGAMVSRRPGSDRMRARADELLKLAKYHAGVARDGPTHQPVDAISTSSS